MIVDNFIENSIKEGSRGGAEQLDATQRMVFLISEAEILCDMEGIDRSSTNTARRCGSNVRVPSKEIATGLRAIAAPDIASRAINGRGQHADH